MAAINTSLVARSEVAVHQLMKRKQNWAQQEPGVIVVFAIVGAVALLLIGLFIQKKVRIPRLASANQALTCSSADGRPQSLPRIRYPSEDDDKVGKGAE